MKIDLATKVADTVFAKRKRESPVFDNWLYALGAVLIIAGMIYSFSFLISFSVLAGFAVIFPVVLYATLSVKEYLTMQRRLLL